MSTSLAPASTSRVLVVDDDEQVLKLIVRSLVSPTREVLSAPDGVAALRILEAQQIDAIVADLQMPGMSGLELADLVHQHDSDVPVILATGAATFESAVRAIEVGVFRYVTKPVRASELVRMVEEAIRTRQLARSRGGHDDRTTLQSSFARTIESLYMVYQPLVEVSTRATVGHEALLRSREPALPHPGAVLEAAEKLGSLHTLGRTTRAHVAAMLTARADTGSMFVNLHPADLADVELYDPTAPLTAHASRVVLEITERASLEGVPNVVTRIDELRKLGFRIAVDDLGAGYAGLNYFARLSPDIVKIDMSLVRGVHQDTVRKRVVRSLVELSRGLGMTVVAEGIETIEERDALVALGCDYLQGYLLARPGAAFPLASWVEEAEGAAVPSTT